MSCLFPVDAKQGNAKKPLGLRLSATALRHPFLHSNAAATLCPSKLAEMHSNIGNPICKCTQKARVKQKKFA